MNRYNIPLYTKNMKKNLLITPFLLLIWLTSCDDVNSLHQKYLDWGEDIYTGVVDSLKVSAGYERVLLTWELNADPRITRTVVYWNSKADSAVIEVNRTQSGRLPMSYRLDNIAEGSYTFVLITRDNEGHFSMPSEIIATIYGESYSSQLRNRGVSAISRQTDGTMLIEWDALSSLDIQYVTVTYDVNGAEQTVRVKNDENKTFLSGLAPGDKIRVFTAYLPEGALDELYSPYTEYTMPKLEREINKANFSTVILAGDNTSVNGVRDLSKIWDGITGNPNILHTVENAAGFSFPHHFTFDMGVLAEISRFRIWPRTDATAFTGHSPRFFEIWGTDVLQADPSDDTYWKSEAWKDDWALMGDHEIVKPTSTTDQATAWAAGWEYEVSDAIGKVRYIRLVIKSPNWQGSNCVNIGEITLRGDDL